MKTSIAYADEVSNPLFARLKGDETSKIGTFCEKPDKDGTCKNCWAETLNMRFGNKLAFDKSNRDKIEWKFRHKELNRLALLNAKKPMSKKFPGLPLFVFCCDTFDIFQPSITDEVRDIVFDFYDRLTDLILLVQTTYPGRMRNYFNVRYGDSGVPSHYRIGMSAGTQVWLNRNFASLISTYAAFRYVIFEPLLEEVRLDSYLLKAVTKEIGKTPLNQIIVGGESGASPRPMQNDWARFLQKQCVQLGIAFFFKQESKFGNKNYNRFDMFAEDLKSREVVI